MTARWHLMAPRVWQTPSGWCAESECVACGHTFSFMAYFPDREAAERVASQNHQTCHPGEAVSSYLEGLGIAARMTIRRIESGPPVDS